MIKAYDVKMPNQRWLKVETTLTDLIAFLESNASNAEIETNGELVRTVESRYRQTIYRRGYRDRIGVHIADGRVFLIRKENNNAE